MEYPAWWEPTPPNVYRVRWRGCVYARMADDSTGEGADWIEVVW